MTAAALRMRLLVDVNVPEAVTRLFHDRGHEVLLVRDLFMPDVEDPIIAKTADELQAIVVTWDKDFKHLISRASEGTRQRFRRAGRISFVNCRYRIGMDRALEFVEWIEFEYAQVQKRHDKRLIVTIKKDQLVLER